MLRLPAIGIAKMRLFYAAGAPADFVAAHQAWAKGTEFEKEVSVTFSSQIEDFVAKVGAEAMLVSGHSNGEQLIDGPIQILHLPKRRASGWRWHLEDWRHARRLTRLARQFAADVAIIDSGTMPYWTMFALRRAGMKVVPVFHNTLYLPRGPSRLQRLERPLTKRLLQSTTPIHVSPECKRQVGHGIEIRAQFNRGRFDSISPAVFANPFNVLFVGRINAMKGVFDIVEAARLCGDEVTWTICGTGPDLERLKGESEGLPIEVCGWTSLEELMERRSRCQAVIAPTTGDFEEGMAMTAVEAILSGRPLITNRFVPALEVLRPACVEAEPENPRSIAEAALSLARDQDRWRRLVAACPPLAGPFYDRRHGLTEALAEILCPSISDYRAPPGAPAVKPAG